MVALSI
jgi:hypothetical protein